MSSPDARSLAQAILATTTTLLAAPGTATELRPPLGHLRGLVSDIEAAITAGDYDTAARAAIGLKQVARCLETIGGLPVLCQTAYALIRAVRQAEPIQRQITRLTLWRNGARARVVALARAGKSALAALERLGCIEVDLHRSHRRLKAQVIDTADTASLTRQESP